MAQPNPAHIINRAAAHYGYVPRELTDYAKFPEIAKARSAAYLAGRIAGFNNSAIARAMHRHPSTVSICVRRAVTMATRDPEFAQACAIIAKGK